jgi:5'(3')-deoxyribonucleotidase
MLKELIIFQDLDGCIANFCDAAMKALGVIEYTIPPNEPNMEKWPGVNCTTKEFWLAIDKTEEDFWVGIEKFPHSDSIIKMLHTYGDVFFLTSPSRNPKCLSGKAMWIKKHYPRMVRNVVYTPAKYLCANSHSILLDDTKSKLDKFAEHGGWTIMWPQPYNEAWAEFQLYNGNYQEYIRVKLEEIKSKIQQDYQT